MLIGVENLKAGLALTHLVTPKRKESYTVDGIMPLHGLPDKLLLNKCLNLSQSDLNKLV